MQGETGLSCLDDDRSAGGRRSPVSLAVLYRTGLGSVRYIKSRGTCTLLALAAYRGCVLPQAGTA
jgi:hypothetical protein